MPGFYASLFLTSQVLSKCVTSRKTKKIFFQPSEFFTLVAPRDCLLVAAQRTCYWSPCALVADRGTRDQYSAAIDAFQPDSHVTSVLCSDWWRGEAVPVWGGMD